MCITCDYEFDVKPIHHWNGSGCPECCDNKKLTQEEIINRIINIHGDKFNLSKVLYESYKKDIIVICNDCGFENNVKPHNLIFSESGCPFCKNKESKSETKITKYLKDNNINFKKQHKFDDCIYKRKLKFDFYLPDLNMCVEYDGRQHYEPVEKFGGDDGFKSVQIRDKIKTDYCKINNIKLLRIKYNEKILEVLDNYLN